MVFFSFSLALTLQSTDNLKDSHYNMKNSRTHEFFVFFHNICTFFFFMIFLVSKYVNKKVFEIIIMITSNKKMKLKADKVIGKLLQFFLSMILAGAEVMIMEMVF